MYPLRLIIPSLLLVIIPPNPANAQTPISGEMCNLQEGEGWQEGDGTATQIGADGAYGSWPPCLQDATAIRLADAGDTGIVGAKWEVAFSRCSLLRGTTELIAAAAGAPVHTCLFEDYWFNGFVEHQGRCLNDNGVAEYDQDNDYEEYGDGCCGNATTCWDWCALQVDDNGDDLNWPSYVACEWDNAGEYCHIYGEATIVGGDGDPDVTCLAPVQGPGTPPLTCGSNSTLEWHYPETPANGWLDVGYCNGTMQSPIDLNGALKATVHAPIEYRNYFVNPHDNNRFYNGILQNNGRTIVWHLHSTEKDRLSFCWKHGKCPSIRNGPFAGVKHTHAYYLLQLQFHWGDNGDQWNKGSEHTVDGMQYPLEMHMIHIEDRYIDSEGTYNWDGALGDPNGLAVLAIFFKVDPKKPQNMQPLEVIDETLEDMANVPKARRKRGTDAEEEAQMEEMARFHEAFEQLFAEDNAHRAKRQILHHTEVNLRLNPGAFIRKATNRGYYANEYSTYWTYHGSLTTPCCNEVVTWVVFDRALHITQVQVNAFTHKFPNTFRTPYNLGSHMGMDRVDTMCGREIRLIHDQIEHHSGGFWG